jgi:hypothetical protein
MSEFVNRGPGGRPRSYPDTPRGGGLAALARNFASGPDGDTAITTLGVQIPWDAIDVPATIPVAENVPITPRVSGIVMVRASIGIQNTSASPRTVIVEVQVNGVTQAVPLHEEFTVPVTNGGEETNGFVQLPILTKIAGLVLGTQVNIQIKVTALTADSLELTDNNSTLELEEVLASTG